MTRTERRRLGRSLALAALLALGLALLSGREGPRGRRGAHPGQRQPPASAPPRPASPPAPPAAAPSTPRARAPAPNQPPRITSATLDRSRLCAGESTLLRMTAEDPDDVDLRYRAIYRSPALGAPRFGFGRWLRFEAPERAGRHDLVAVVEDPARGRDEVALEVVVEECASPPPFDTSQLSMRHAELDALVHEFDLSDALARARDAGKELEVLRWHFGDGATAEGAPRVRHQYPVVLDRRYSYYLVHADVRLDGDESRIEYGLSFYSYAAANLDAGYVALAADVERGNDASSAIEYVVTFSNLTPFSAWAREFELTCLDAAGLPADKWREPLDLTVPGETSLEQTLTLDRERCPGGASYELFGQAEGGYSVGGLWSYRLRPSAGGPDRKRARERARAVLLRRAGR